MKHSRTPRVLNPATHDPRNLVRDQRDELEARITQLLEQLQQHATAAKGHLRSARTHTERAAQIADVIRARRRQGES